MTFLEQLLKESAPMRYPARLERLGGSVACRTHGVDVVMDVNSDWVHLVRLRTPKALAGKGQGRKALRWLTRLANKYRLQLRLYPQANAHKALTTAQLRAWYRREGFRRVGGGWMAYN